MAEDSKNFIFQLTTKTPDERDELYARLTDIFGETVSNQHISQICLQNNYEEESCVEKLLKLVDNPEVSSNNANVSTPLALTNNTNETNNSSREEWSNGHNQKPERHLGAIPKITNIIPQRNDNSNNDQRSDLDDVVDTINKGYKVMVLMRGAPGTGKSTLAREIINRTTKTDHRNHIFSSDDYFHNIHDEYVYRPDRIQEAHEFNQKRVRQRAASGWSPIIVDNTNVKIWEMGPYVQTAALYCYIVKIVQPKNPYCNSAGKLAARNVHGVPRDRIQRMLDNFEPVTVEELFKINNVKYSSSMPQLRHCPPLPVESSIISPTVQNDHDIAEDGLQSWQSYDNISKEVNNSETINIPKPKRGFFGGTQSFQILDDMDTIEDFSGIVRNATENFWAYSKPREEFTAPKPVRSAVANTEDIEKNLLTALKDLNVNNSKDNHVENIPISPVMTRHKIGCPNESKSFYILRQIYPNKRTEALWDLFEKCNGDIDWTIDILLRDKSNNDQPNDFVSENYFTCNCNSEEIVEVSKIVEEDPAEIVKKNELVKPQRPKTRKERTAEPTGEMLETKNLIEKQFVIGNQHYSDHVKKIRNMRYGILEPELDLDTTLIPENDSNATLQNNDEAADDDDSSDPDNDELLEINLGMELIEQLENAFKVEQPTAMTTANSNIRIKTNVFMPKYLAKQLYALWVESLNNQIEEQKQTSIKEDEEFAKFLTEQSLSEYHDPPKNFKELMDMEMAWTIYKNENWKNSTNDDLATHLTKMKLFEIFPNVDPNTLLEIFNAHGNQFFETVETLKNSMNVNLDEKIKIKGIELMEKAQTESDKGPKTFVESYFKESSDAIRKESKMQPEEAKRAAIKDFEESRNLAVHHSQLKGECYCKAKEAIQKGNTAVAVYYSQIANLHKAKIDMLNQKAANCIMEVHDLNQTNPDFIDLHYLHVVEAIECLDIFIDKHISKMKNMSRSYKHIFIITGRGLHSSGGISAIKNRVKLRLRERKLKWSEVNPGLLKVKLFSTSKYSKNINV